MNARAATALIAAAPTLFRQGLLALLRERWPLLLLNLTADATQVPDLVAHHAFALLILDGTLPHLDLPALLTRLHQARPTQRLVVLADTPALARRHAPLAWPGTQLLVPSQVAPQALATALAPWLDALLAEQPVPERPTPLPDSHFSARELQVLRLVVEDHCNEEIANRLFINVRTVESHRRNLLHKAGTRTLVGLAARAVREGWVA
ncbi:MAG: LuxR C-terminal-related transcriptional regulator [Janthinobacterium lividum]